MNNFLGYRRPDGSVGIRNWVLILPAQREVNLLAVKIGEMVRGTRTVAGTGEGGRPQKDRETIARTLIGLGRNPNTAAVLIVSEKAGSGYPELRQEVLEEKIAQSGKPVRVLSLSGEGGFYRALGEGIRIARGLVAEVSDARREPCNLSPLCLGVKCGISDPTSGIAGNPVVGAMFDRVVQAGGTAFFSETTEIIGAENLLVKRAASAEVARAILEAVKITEGKALATGEDIRSINPIPSNIAAGITTLEEKSLGAIAKGGSSPIRGVLAYGQRPPGPGLYFVDAWMSSLSLPLGYAASGAQLFLYQMGGGGLAESYPAMPAVSSGIVTPLMYLTGNRRTYEKARDSIDFDSSPVMEGRESVEEAGDRLLKRVLDIASGSRTKMETLRYQDPIEFFMEGPCL
jgi:altronate dehydratase large subunit